MTEIDFHVNEPMRPGAVRNISDVLAVYESADLLPSAAEGSMALTLNPLALYVRKANIWTPIASAGDPPPPTVVSASETEAGVAELATQAETDLGGDNFRIVTPLKLATHLAARTATETAAGFVEHATEAEVQAGSAGNLVATVARLKAELDRRAAIEAWIAPTLLNGWLNFGGVAEAAGYRKTPAGEVQLKGLIKSGTMTSGTILFSLPVGYRPAASRWFVGLQGNATACRIAVSTAGEVAIVGVTDNASLSLEAVRFDAA